jgi:hypothetical protein
MNGLNNKLQSFWIENTKKLMKRLHVKDSQLSASNWENNLKGLTYWHDIRAFLIPLRREIFQKGGGLPLAKKPLSLVEKEEIQEYNKILHKEIENWESERDSLVNQRDTYKSKGQNYEIGLKAIIGEENLTNWEDKITKTENANKDITDLRKEIKSLQTEKNNLAKQLKEKEDQIVIHLNHRCNTPDNAVLNQIKDRLKQITQERDKLKEELNQKGPDIPEENLDNLTVEELKTIINQKQREIAELKSERAGNGSHTPNPNYVPGLLGLGGLLLVGLVVYGIIIAKKKKKKLFKRSVEWELPKDLLIWLKSKPRLTVR